MHDSLFNASDSLRQHADLDRFWLLETNRIQPGLIHYLDAQGQAFTLMDDDDERVERCVTLLTSKNYPVFDDITAMDKYA